MTVYWRIRMIVLEMGNCYLIRCRSTVLVTDQHVLIDETVNNIWGFMVIKADLEPI